MSLTTILYLTEVLKTIEIIITIWLFVVSVITFIVLPVLLCRGLCFFKDESQYLLLKRYIKIGAVVSCISLVVFILYPSGDIIDLLLINHTANTMCLAN